MEKHYQIVNGDIVFNVVDEETVLEELEEALDKAFENHGGEESIQFIVETSEEFMEPEDGSPSEYYTALCISAPDCGLIINYTAKAPTLVNVDGKFCHYWDFVLSDHTVTDLYADESDEKAGSLEDAVIKAIEASA